MAKLIQEQKLLYHITALDNIESILKNGLLPRREINNYFIDVAEQDIIDFRDKKGISNLIPFHFFKGTPFSGIVQKTYCDKEFVYITIHRDIAKKYNFMIFPTHPKHMEKLELLDYDNGIKNINWTLMNTRDYSNYECKEVCMAECVALYKKIPPSFFHSIIVKSKDTQKYINNLCLKIFKQECRPSFYIDIEPYSFLGK